MLIVSQCACLYKERQQLCLLFSALGIIIVYIAFMVILLENYLNGKNFDEMSSINANNN